MSEYPTSVDADLLVLGGGPVGLYAAYCAGFRGMTSAIVDSLPELGGQVAAMYPEKPIYDIAGLPSIKGKDLISNLVEQASAFSPTLLLDERAEILQHSESEGRRFRVITRSGTQIDCSAIVISGGIGTFTPRPLACASDYLGRGVDHFVSDPDVYSGKNVFVVGGGDSALDWSLLLQQRAARTTLVHRRDSFRAHQHSIDLIEASDVEVLTPTQVTQVGGDDRVEWVEVTDLESSQVTRRDADAIVVAMGFTANLGPLNDWGIDIDSRRYITVDSTMRTSTPGIYAAGDITNYVGKVRLISVGFGEAAIAVNHAVHEIDSSQAVFPGHSTDQYLPAVELAGVVS